MKHKGLIFSGAVILALVSVSACNSQQRSSKAAAHQNATQKHAVDVAWSHTVKRDVKDPAYGMTAFTVSVPVGWKFVGTILRPSGCHGPVFPASGLSYTVLSPDGISAYEQLPGVSWTWTSNGSNMLGPKCPSNISIDTADAFLLNIAIPHLHPNAKVVKILPNPQTLRDAIAQHDEQETAKLRRNGLKGRAYSDVGGIRIAYERNGRPVEEIVGTLIYCSEIQVTPPMQRPHMQRRCFSGTTTIKRAPKGYLDAVKPLPPPAINKEWDARVSQDMGTAFHQMQAASDRQFQAMQQHFSQQTQQILANGRQFRAQQRDSTDRALQADRNQQAAIDDAAHQTALHSLDRQTFINPDTGQKIEASSQYNHQWISSDGQTLIQNQDPSFDPNGTVYPVSQSWTELVPQ